MKVSAIPAGFLLEQFMSRPFLEIMADLADCHKQFMECKITPLEHGSRRGTLLAEALNSVADECGVHLKQPLQINANGEFSIVSLKHVDANPEHGCGPYGDAFAEFVTTAKPRAGAVRGITMSATDGWCYVNHFDVEKALLLRKGAL